MKEPHRAADGPLRAFLRDRAERSSVADRLVSLVAPGSFAADQYRSLRHSVERLLKDSGFQVLLVTSAGPGDGKSVTTLNLAGALAQSADARILVIDADLRRPSAAEYLGLESAHLPGLADAILDPEYELSDVVRRLNAFNLSVVPAGAATVAHYELLNSPRLESLLKEARRLYDCVLIDTPPVVPFPDCRLLGRWSDGVLLVVGANRTPRKLIAEALSLLDPAKVIAVAFNGDKRPLSGHYGYEYYNTSGRSRHLGWRLRVWTAASRYL